MVFLIEIIFNILVYGLLLGPNTFFQKYSNIFNFILVMSFFLGINATEENFITYVNNAKKYFK